MTGPHPALEFFSIGEVCALTDLKPHVLRYWESQFRILSPAKNRSGNRVYRSREVELILLVKHLLYTEKFTIEGARLRLETYRKNGELKSAARSAASPPKAITNTRPNVSTAHRLLRICFRCSGRSHNWAATSDLRTKSPARRRWHY